MEARNITLSLPEYVLRDAEVMAARRGTSVSALLAGALHELVERESGYAAAREKPGGTRQGQRLRYRWPNKLGPGRAA